MMTVIFLCSMWYFSGLGGCFLIQLMENKMPTEEDCSLIWKASFFGMVMVGFASCLFLHEMYTTYREVRNNRDKE